MPLLRGRGQIAIKQEAVAGTAIALTADEVVATTGIAEWETDVMMTPRQAMTASLSPRGSVVGTQAAKIRFKQWLGGSYTHSTGALAFPVASNEAAFAIPFRGCGVMGAISGTTPNEQASYKPTTSLVVDETTGAYCTVALYLDGKIYKIHGAVGNCVLTFTTGAPTLAEYEFTGVYNAPTDGVLLVPVYPSFVEPAFLGASLSVIGSYTAARISTLKLDFGNTIGMRPFPNNATGLHTAQITGRNPTGSFDPEETLAATNNYFSQWIAGTTGSITTGVFGGTNYNSLSLTIPAAAYTKVTLGDRDGIATAPIDFECRANSSAGDDEWELVQT